MGGPGRWTKVPRFIVALLATGDVFAVVVTAGLHESTFSEAFWDASAFSAPDDGGDSPWGASEDAGSGARIFSSSVTLAASVTDSICRMTVRGSDSVGLLVDQAASVPEGSSSLATLAAILSLVAAQTASAAPPPKHGSSVGNDDSWQ